MAEQKQVSVAAIQQDLKDGLDRKQIREKYGYSAAEMAAIFQHPNLKGLRVKKPATAGLVFVDEGAEVKRKGSKATASSSAQGTVQTEEAATNEVTAEATENNQETAASEAEVETAKPKTEAEQEAASSEETIAKQKQADAPQETAPVPKKGVW